MINNWRTDTLARLMDPRARVLRTLVFLGIGVGIAYFLVSIFTRVQLVQTPAQEAALTRMTAAKGAYEAGVATLARLRPGLAKGAAAQQRRVGLAYQRASDDCLLAARLYASAAAMLDPGFVSVRGLPLSLPELACR